MRNMVWVLSVLLGLMACEQGADDRNGDSATLKAALPALTASGNEPPWMLFWDGEKMIISHGIERKTSTYMPQFKVGNDAMRWTYEEDDLYVVVVKKECLDLAGNVLSYDFDIQINKTERLVGCGVAN